MYKISHVSAATPSYEEACGRFNLDLENPRLLSAGGDGVLLNPWQVIGLAWAVGQEASHFRGGIIADACGIGKTIQMLSVIAESAARMEEAEE